MKYVVRKEALFGTRYHELAMEEWDGETFWREDTVYLHDDILYEHTAKAIVKVIPEYDLYGEVAIDCERRKMLDCFMPCGGI